MLRLAAWMIIPVVLLIAAPASGDDLARLMPPEVVVYVEARSPAAVVDFVDKWAKGLGILERPLTSLGKEAGLEPEQVAPELRKVKGAAFAVTRIDRAKEDAVLLLVADLGDAKLLRDGIERRLKALGDKPAATVNGVEIRGADESFGCLVGQVFIFGSSLDDVKATIERLKPNPIAPLAPSLADNKRFHDATSALDANSPLFSFQDIHLVYQWLKEQEGQNDDLAALDAALDLKNVDTVVSELSVKDAREVVRLSIAFSGDNRSYAAFRTASSARTAAKFFTGDYGLVHAGTLIDGKEQWLRFKEIKARLDAMDQDDDFLAGLGRLEEALKTKAEDELGNVTEYAIGVRAGDGGIDQDPETLIALKLTDPARAVALMKRVEEEAAANPQKIEIKERDAEGVKVRYASPDPARSDYAWAVVDGYLLLGNHAKGVCDAVHAWKSGKSVLDEPGVKKALSGLHEKGAKLLLINPLGFMPPMARNPNAPPMSFLAMTTLEEPRRVEICIDFSQMGGILRNLAGILRMGF